MWDLVNVNGHSIIVQYRDIFPVTKCLINHRYATIPEKNPELSNNKKITADLKENPDEK